MNERSIVARLTARFALENDLGMDPMMKRVAEYLKDNHAPSDADFHGWAEDEGVDKHAAEAAAYRLAALACDFLFHGRADDKGISDEDVDETELAMGVEVEMEHTSNPVMSKRIALDHLAETRGAPLQYYTALKLMEKFIELLRDMDEVEAQDRISKFMSIVEE